MPTDERVIVPFEQAVAMLPEGDPIHTFRQAGNVLLGADWPREDIIDLMRDKTVEKTGEIATRMGHGLAVQENVRDWLFIATKKEATPFPA